MVRCRLREMSSDPGKQALRKTLLDIRAAMSRDELVARSAALTEHLLAHPLWLEARGVAAFVGVLRGEVVTMPLLERTLAAGKRLWLPRLTTPGHMAFWACDDLATLETRRMGLREPPIVGEGALMPGPEEGGRSDLGARSRVRTRRGAHRLRCGALRSNVRRLPDSGDEVWGFADRVRGSARWADPDARARREDELPRYRRGRLHDRPSVRGRLAH